MSIKKDTFAPLSKGLGATRRAAATLLLATLMLAAAPQRAWADTESVNYIDADGNAQTVTATVLTGNEEPSRWGTIDLAAGWYVVKGNISYTNQISYGSSTGTIHIILADGAQMSVECNDKVAISPFLPLAIYGQSAGTGRLSVTSDRYAIYASGGITINGGIVSATCTGYGHPAIYAGNGAITINGGQVTATPGDNAMGIATEGTITLGLRSTSDFITANGYSGTVNIKDGQTLYAGATAYSGNNVSLPSGAVTLRPYSSDDFSVNDAGTEYTIHTATGWNVFCDLLAENDKGYFTGKTIVLGADISVSRMAGSSYHDFTGTFDGQGHTLTVSYGSADSPIAENNAAPFRNAESGCVIENLHVTGAITTSQKFAAGLVGTQYGAVTIRNCHVSTVIHSLTSGDGTHGGIVGSNGNGEGSSVTIEGCLFDGKLLTEGETATTNCSGFVGYRSNNRTIAITNSLYAPADLADGETEVEDGKGTISATFVRNGAAGTNCYYTRALGTPQGKAPRTIAAGDNVTIEAKALTGETTEYDVSGITAYSGGGLQCGQTLYYGSGDEVSLTLSNTAPDAPLGYQYGYTASAGTLSGSTFTMPDEDVTISLGDLTVIDWTTANAGTSADPYMIYNKDQLDLLAHRVNGTHGETLQSDGYDGKYFQLGADIAYSHSTDWNDADCEQENNYEAIGYYRSFSGDFDGAGHTVSGIRIHRSGSDYADRYQGIFSQTSSSANIHSLRLADARITGYNFTGGIVGLNYGTVTDCHVANNVCIHTVQPFAYHHGGIVGQNNGTVGNCTSAATLTIASDANGCRYYGAIAGYNEVGTLSDNLAIGATVPAADDNAYGAIVGYTYNGTLQRNYYTACKVASENVTPSGVGYQNADITANDGAVPALRDNADNTQAIALLATLAQTDDDRPVLPLDLGWGEGQFPLQLASRTLYKDGAWNTLCLPFDVTVSGSVLDGAVARPLSEASISGSVLNLTFGDAVDELVAGTPYIIKWASGDDIVSPVFNGVTIDATNRSYDNGSLDDERVRFLGTYDALTFTAADVNSVMLMGGSNKLYYAGAGAHLGACRAYFKIGEDDASARQLTGFSIDFGDGNTTGILEMERMRNGENEKCFDLQGRRVGKPTQRGIYIMNGKKMVIK